MSIQTAILGAMRDIAKTGIAKLGKASLGGATVNYRGIEQAMNQMSLILIDNGITVTPCYSDLTITERLKGDPKDGKATRFATIKGAFTFAAEDGSNVICTAYGEAMDSGDKAVTKAQSVSFRTALFQQFVVPTMAMDPEADPEDSQEDRERFLNNPDRLAWIREQLEAIAGAKTVGELKSIMEVALGTVREQRDPDAERQLLEAQAAKIAKAKQKATA